ncbi:AraC family transcriptional regulator [Tepidibacter aestuarii]|uniref:AraC family transcriptional regulator n=1 Tax=Tepidibacter aestuarii TaxID=2925782 RepID=UPI0020BFCEBA|nr:AraC family transcriptional regulator [Tepidibacter aestuarii]CAH2212178.1 HTH araC/xylS-type domain-containing protein [Tepidibacter aestuarii]
MDTIKRIEFYKNKNKNFDFEIIRLKDFFGDKYIKYITHIHRLNFYNILCITSGKSQHEIDFKLYPYKAGDILLISKNQVQRFYPKGDIDGYLILFTDTFLYRHLHSNISEFLEPFQSTYLHPIVKFDNNSDGFERIQLDTLYKYYIDKNNVLKPEILKSHLRTLMLLIKRNSLENQNNIDAHTYEKFITFMNLVEDNFKHKKTVQEYADLMYVSKKTVNSITRKAVDLSAKQFIIDRVILEIKRYLSQGDLTVNEIAEITGFDEPSNLTKFFKRYEGLTPSEFRKKQQIYI